MASYTTDMRARLIDEHDAAFCAKLMAEMATSETWWTPTLQVLRMGALADRREFRNDPRKRYVLMGRLMPGTPIEPRHDRGDTWHHVDYELYEAAKRSVREAHGAEVAS